MLIKVCVDMLTTFGEALDIHTIPIRYLVVRCLLAYNLF